MRVVEGALCTDGGYLADVLGVYVCVSGVTWSVKGNHGTIEGTFVVCLLLS